jgi:hypothetical protein
MTHDPDQLLYLLGERIDQLEEAMTALAQKDAALRSWEALQATQMMGSGTSAAAAEKAVKALPEWKAMYLETEDAKVSVEILKHRIRLGQNFWETWRSKHSAERRATQ